MQIPWQLIHNEAFPNIKHATGFKIREDKATRLWMDTAIKNMVITFGVLFVGVAAVVMLFSGYA